MESCLIIHGISGNGKTFAGRLLSSKLEITQIEFDNVINFISEMTRIKIGESDPNFNFRDWFIQRLPFNDDDEDLIACRNACDALISRNIDFFKKFYNKLIINKKSTKYYPTEDHKLCIDLGKNGIFLEPLGDEIMDLVLKYLIKQNKFIILEGYNLKEGPYRRAIEKICQNTNYLECHYKDHKDKFIYNLNGNGIKNIIELENSVKKLLKSKRPAYQIFSENSRGDSKSFEKLEKLGIPEKLENKSVLDLGCNEGFFCFECERRGARCLGIERDPHWYNQALERKNEFGSFVNFINQSWDLLPTINYKFDVAIFLAAFHYIKDNQLEVLTNVYNKLKNEGMLILEIGILEKNEGEFLVENVKRPAGDICQFTNKFTIEKLLHDAGFDEIQYYGTGWDIRGDDIPRYVIHALKTKNPKKENISELPKISQEEQKERIEIPFSSKEIGEMIIKAYKQNAFYRAIIKIGYKILNKKNSK